MANDISTQTGFNGSSMALNTQKGEGGQKPSAQGKHNPGDTHPGMPKTVEAPIAK
jgi:hypothetical protein